MEAHHGLLAGEDGKVLELLRLVRLVGLLEELLAQRVLKHRLITVYLTLFYTRGLEIVVLHVMVPQPYRFSPLFFHIGMVI